MYKLTAKEISKLLSLVKREISDLDPFGNCHLTEGPESNAVQLAVFEGMRTKLQYQYNMSNYTDEGDCVPHDQSFIIHTGIT